MNIYDQMRALIDRAQDLPQDMRRYQVRRAASETRGIIVDTWATEGASFNATATATAAPSAGVDLTMDIARVVAALLNLGFPAPVNPAVIQLIVAFMPEAEDRENAHEYLFDSIQVAVTAMLQSELPPFSEHVGLHADELGLRVRGIVEHRFAYRPMS